MIHIILLLGSSCLACGISVDFEEKGDMDNLNWVSHGLHLQNVFDSD